MMRGPPPRETGVDDVQPGRLAVVRIGVPRSATTGATNEGHLGAD